MANGTWLGNAIQSTAVFENGMMAKLRTSGSTAARSIACVQNERPLTGLSTSPHYGHPTAHSTRALMRSRHNWQGFPDSRFIPFPPLLHSNFFHFNERRRTLSGDMPGKFRSGHNVLESDLHCSPSFSICCKRRNVGVRSIYGGYCLYCVVARMFMCGLCAA